jgi:hypothetical protein
LNYKSEVDRFVILNFFLFFISRQVHYCLFCFLFSVFNFPSRTLLSFWFCFLVPAGDTIVFYVFLLLFVSRQVQQAGGAKITHFPS